jgi:hypothetical protein
VNHRQARLLQPHRHEKGPGLPGPFGLDWVLLHVLLERGARLERRYPPRRHLDLFAGAGLRAVRAERLRRSNVPNPGSETRSPFWTAPSMAFNVASRTSPTVRLLSPVLEAMESMSSPLFNAASLSDLLCIGPAATLTKTPPRNGVSDLSQNLPPCLPRQREPALGPALLTTATGTELTPINRKNIVGISSRSTTVTRSISTRIEAFAPMPRSLNSL